MITGTALAIGLWSSPVEAAVTLNFSSITQRATNWLDASGSATTLMVWGVVVDTAHNGFNPGSYLPSFVYSPGVDVNKQPWQLPTAGGGADDVLLISSTLMVHETAGVDGAFPGVNGLRALTQIPLFGGTGLLAGAPFAIIWFNQTSFNSVALGGDSYGFYSQPSFTMPTVDNTVASFANRFAGPDAPQPMQYSLVPEPGVAALCSVTVLLAGWRRSARRQNRPAYD